MKSKNVEALIQENEDLRDLLEDLIVRIQEFREDLGINHGAVCSVVNASGTIEARYFDPFVSERDRLEHLINRLRKVSRSSGVGQSLSAIYTKLDGVKTN